MELLIAERAIYVSGANPIRQAYRDIPKRNLRGVIGWAGLTLDF